jgi:uncharacterized phage protein (TIGR01671 family)
MKAPKFRVWNRVKKDFFDPGELKVSVDFSRIGGWVKSLKDYVFVNIESYDVIIQQYIGLKDKHGKEIYEGDLLEFAYTDDKKFVGEVKYSEKFACFVVISENAFETFLDLADHTESFNVIGNIMSAAKTETTLPEGITVGYTEDKCFISVRDQAEINFSKKSLADVVETLISIQNL